MVWSERPNQETKGSLREILKSELFFAITEKAQNHEMKLECKICASNQGAKPRCRKEGDINVDHYNVFNGHLPWLVSLSWTKMQNKHTMES